MDIVSEYEIGRVPWRIPDSGGAIARGRAEGRHKQISLTYANPYKYWGGQV